ncbi:hypothetical protein Daus18300_013576 [Diaporthe australafricana]|uniref:Killer toxin Kp4 domain-containing protein n=1 Tax=Diaporthe australafricana TaxID=127596 RepID=A0ABR3VYI6_9PEZI
MQLNNYLYICLSLLAVSPGAQAGWDGPERDDVQCSKCAQGKAVRLYEDDQMNEFCDKIVDMYSNSDWDDHIGVAGTAGSLGFEVDERDSSYGPDDREDCLATLSSVIGGCPTCSVANSAEIYSGDTKAGLLVAAGSCLCADPATCGQTCA